MQTHELFKNATFRKSNKSGNLGCVEVARRTDRVGVRDSKNRNAAVLVFTEGEWRVFTDSIKSGALDLPR